MMPNGVAFSSSMCTFTVFHHVLNEAMSLDIHLGMRASVTHLTLKLLQMPHKVLWLLALTT